MKIKSILSVLLIAILLVVAVTTIVKKNIADEEKVEVITGKQAQDAGGLKVGQKAPDFKLQTLDGKEIALSDFKGKKVMINFWATWCPPCKAETPEMVKYYNAHAKDENFEILSVNAMSTESKSESVGKFIEDYEMTFPVVIDPRGEIIKQYEVLNFPTSFFINTEGVIQEKLNLIDEKQLTKVVKSLD
ncbi:MAG: redoxin domain-containing protein [Kurthia sp.]|nr:redoxin domain-containing protein [Candidatus Kurthia equi]